MGGMRIWGIVVDSEGLVALRDVTAKPLITAGLGAPWQGDMGCLGNLAVDEGCGFPEVSLGPSLPCGFPQERWAQP